MLIQTIHGLTPLEELEVHDQVEWFDNARKTTTTWTRSGELVRQDVHVHILRGLAADAAQGGM